MTGTKRKKYRGSRTHGCGSHKKRRGAGSRGGVGRAGSAKHMKLYFKKREALKKKKLKSLERRRLRKKSISITIRDLSILSLGKKEIDLTKFGFGKVVGTGQIKHPVAVTALGFTPSAKAKIEKAGGKTLAAIEEFEAESPKEGSKTGKA